MKFRILLCFFIVLLVTHAKATPPTQVNALLPKFEALIKKSMKERQIPGMAVAIIKDGQVVFMKGFGVRERGRPEPIDNHTVFQIGSTSKAITSVLVAILSREKIINLDDPIETIPNVTLKHVLSHTTGIPSKGFNALIERGIPADEIYTKVKETIPENEPGEQFAYHNAVYNLIEQAIERQNKASFENILQTRLLGPLSMNETSSKWDIFAAKTNRASVHTFKISKGKKGKAKDKKIQNASFRQEYNNFPAAAGCSSSIHDMALFLSAILGARPDIISLQDIENFIKPIVHTPDQWFRARMHRDRITETHYGLGWRTMTFGGRHLVFHAGWIRGISSIVSFIPEEKLGIVILQNAEEGLPFRLSMQFYDWALGLPAKEWLD